MIDENKLVEDIETLKNQIHSLLKEIILYVPSRCDNQKEISEKCRNIRAELDSFQETYNNMSQANQWVPCSERPPKEAVKGEMNCWVYGFTDYGAIVPTFYKDGCFHDEKSEPVSGYEIIAWIPLPEPYKKEGESNGSN